MTLVLTENKHLASPTKLLPLPPTILDTITPLTDLLEVSESDGRDAILEQARKLVLAHAHSATALARLAQAEQNHGNLIAAADAARRAIEVSKTSQDPSAIAAAIRVLIGCGEYDIAEALISGKRIQDPWSALYAGLAARRCDTEVALERLEGQETPDALGLRGWLYLKRRQHDRAIAAFRRALRVGPLSSSILGNLGYAHAIMGALEKGIQETRQACSLSPSNKRLRYNLASYYAGAGEYHLALSELAYLRKIYPQDVKVRLAIASVELQSERFDRSLRTLRQAKAQLYGSASQSTQSELNANIAFVEWKLGRRSDEPAWTTVLQELDRTGYRRLGIVSLLTAMVNARSRVMQLSQVYEKLKELHPVDKLWEVDATLNFSLCRFEEATESTLAWANSQPFSVDAATTATYLLSDFKGDYNTAAELGLATLRRAPGSWMLANNAAYSLALAGRLSEARRVLPRNGNDPYITATAALIELLSGHNKAGIAGYERAEELASQRGDRKLSSLLRLRRSIILAELRLGEEGLSDEAKRELRMTFSEDPRFKLLETMSERTHLRLP